MNTQQLIQSTSRWSLFTTRITAASLIAIGASAFSQETSKDQDKDKERQEDRNRTTSNPASGTSTTTAGREGQSGWSNYNQKQGQVQTFEGQMMPLFQHLIAHGGAAAHGTSASGTASGTARTSPSDSSSATARPSTSTSAPGATGVGATGVGAARDNATSAQDRSLAQRDSSSRDSNTSTPGSSTSGYANTGGSVGQPLVLMASMPGHSSSSTGSDTYRSQARDSRPTDSTAGNIADRTKDSTSTSTSDSTKNTGANATANPANRSETPVAGSPWTASGTSGASGASGGTYVLTFDPSDPQSRSAYQMAQAMFQGSSSSAANWQQRSATDPSNTDKNQSTGDRTSTTSGTSSTSATSGTLGAGNTASTDKDRSKLDVTDSKSSAMQAHNKGSRVKVTGRVIESGGLRAIALTSIEVVGADAGSSTLPAIR